MEIQNSAIPIKMLTDDGKIMHTKVIDIGIWNMDLDNLKQVAHGLGTAWLKILSIDAYIFADGYNTFSPITWVRDQPDPQLINGGISSVSDTLISLYRRTGGMFDSVSFDDIAINRGYIVVWYFE